MTHQPPLVVCCIIQLKLLINNDLLGDLVDFFPTVVNSSVSEDFFLFAKKDVVIGVDLSMLVVNFIIVVGGRGRSRLSLMKSGTIWLFIFFQTFFFPRRFLRQLPFPEHCLQ
jgi:hypothetical protein